MRPHTIQLCDRMVVFWNNFWIFHILTRIYFLSIFWQCFRVCTFFWLDFWDKYKYLSLLTLLEHIIIERIKLASIPLFLIGQTLNLSRIDLVAFNPLGEVLNIGFKRGQRFFRIVGCFQFIF